MYLTTLVSTTTCTYTFPRPPLYIKIEDSMLLTATSGVMVARKYCFIAFSEGLLLFGQVFTSISELAVYVGKIC